MGSCVCVCVCVLWGWVIPAVNFKPVTDSLTTPPRPTQPHRPSQNGADKAAPFNLSQMCSPAPVCRANFWRNERREWGGKEGGGVACKVLPSTSTHVRVSELSHFYQEKKPLLDLIVLQTDTPESHW